MSDARADLVAATLAAVVPFAVWMALLFTLPATAADYATRTALTAAALAWFVSRGALDRVLAGTAFHLFAALGAGLLVCVLWIAPESIAWYRDFSLLGAIGLGGGAVDASSPSPYDPAVCGWALTIVKLLGSAFVIAPVEELFYRSFLYRWLQRGDWLAVDPRKFDLPAFLWMVGLFALEHHTRLAAGAMAGAVYGWLAIRRGIVSAMIAHATTNLLLGIYVIVTRSWHFW